MLEWRTIFIPLSAGMNTGADPRALEAPALAVCRDAMFEEPGGAQTRFPFVSIGNNIFGGGTLSNIRRVVPNGDELLCFTKDTLYSWSVRDTAWVSKGTHLATKVTERQAFVNTQEQRLADRCEIGGCVIFAWVEKTSSGGEQVYVAAQDKTTGAVVLDRTHVDDGTRSGVTRPRLVPLAANALLFFIDDMDNLKVIDLNPATLAADLETAGTTVTASAEEYDACPNAAGTSAFVAAALTTTYEVALVSSAAAITANATKVRAADGPIAVAASPGATQMQVGRVVDNATTTPDVRGDVLNATTLADVTVNVLVGSIDASGNGPINQLAACYRSVQVGGQWSCHLFWTHDETTSPVTASAGYTTRTNTLNDAGTAGTAAQLFTQMSVASRAFDHDGRVYFWGAFGIETPFGSTKFRAALQNSYFLYRDDGFLCAKAVTTRSSGYSQEEGYLPGVQSLGSNVYGFCGIERRLISVTSKQRTYAARAPREVLVEFDSSDGRRCVRLGRTLYVTGGEVLAYDGRSVVEVGWHVFPWRISVAEGGAGNQEAGTRTYGATFRGDNAQGERDRSALVSTSDVTVGASKKVNFTIAGFLAATHRDDSCVEIWRTQVSPTVDAPMNLVTSNDPSVTSVGDNGYLPNIEGTYGETDNFSDATLITKEALDQVGDVLERLAPPPATIIAATQDRIFLAGIAGEPNQVWYSRLRDKDEVAAFHDGNVLEVPPTGGKVTALAFLNETLVVFCEHAVWAVPGDGFSNVGGADGSRNYGPARLLSADVGAVNPDAVALSPRGLEFHSSKGKMLLGQDWSVEYVGNPVADFDSDTHVSVHVLEKKHEVRWLTSSRMLVFNYKVGQWSEWTVANGVHAAMWNGTHHYASSTAVLAYQTAYGTNVTYAMDLETAWIPVGIGGKLGRGKVLWIQVLGEVVSTHDLRLRVGRDYLSDSSGATLFQSKFWPATPTTVGGRLQVQHAPSIRLMEAVKLRITPYASGSTTNPPTGGALKVTGFALHVGLEKGIWRSLAAAQRQ